MYQLRPPSLVLHPYVEHLWFVRPLPGQDVDLRVNVFVDGRADLIFNLGAPYERTVIGGSTHQMTASNLDAQRLEPICIVQRGAVHTCGVRFRLGGLGAFVRQPLALLTNQTPEIAAVFGPDADDLATALAEATSIDAQAARIESFLQAALNASDALACVGHAVDSLVSSGGLAAIADVSMAAGVKPRQLERLFARHVGIAPKRVAAIVRFQTALKMLMRDPGCALAEVAAAAGFYDQAHFIREFRRHSGGVPRGYRGYFPEAGPADFAPNVVVFVQDAPASRR